MRMSSPFCVVFAGVPGSSKTIIAYYLSLNFRLPILSTDNIRFEIKEDLLVDNINEPAAHAQYNKRYEDRLLEALKQQSSFIHDGSVDRRWPELKQRLIDARFDYFLVSLDLSKHFLSNLYLKTGRKSALDQLDAYYEQHDVFRQNFAQDVAVSIGDNDFLKRNQITSGVLAAYLDQKS